jgi:hypothetical protein
MGTRLVSFLADDASGSVGTHLLEYTYLGLGMVVTVDYTEPDIHLDLAFGGASDPFDVGWHWRERQCRAEEQGSHCQAPAATCLFDRRNTSIDPMRKRDRYPVDDRTNGA